MEDGQELETFLPQADGSGAMNTTYKVSIVTSKKKVETNPSSVESLTPFDPFKNRNQETATTDGETLVHLLKGSLGSGILSMPFAFKCAGLSFGLLCTAFVAVACTYCAYILVKCAHKLYHRTRVSQMSYPDVAEIAFANGPDPCRRFSKAARTCVTVGLFATYFGAVSVYTIISAESFREVFQYHTDYNLDVRLYVLCLLPPLIFLGFIPNFKALAPFSFIANVLMVISLCITGYFLLANVQDPRNLNQMPTSWRDFPQVFSITVFAMEAIGLVMPLENNMRNPRHFIGLCGVLNRGMLVVAIVYILVGMLGYIRFGDHVLPVVTQSLPIDNTWAQVAKVCIGMAVFLTYTLQYFVCLEILWNGVKRKFSKRPILANYVIRVVLVTSSVLFAVLVPQIAPFVGLIGALCFSFLGILFPLCIDVITNWETESNFKRFYKNFVFFAFGLACVIFGTYVSVLDIMKVYTNTPVSNNTPISISQ